MLSLPREIRSGFPIGRQFRPDQVPVVRPQVAAGYGTIGGDLDGGATIGRNFPSSIPPEAHRLWGDVDGSGQR